MGNMRCDIWGNGCVCVSETFCLFGEAAVDGPNEPTGHRVTLLLVRPLLLLVRRHLFLIRPLLSQRRRHCIGLVSGGQHPLEPCERLLPSRLVRGEGGGGGGGWGMWVDGGLGRCAR